MWKKEKMKMVNCPKCGKKTTSYLEVEFCDRCYTEEKLDPYKLLEENEELKQQLAEKEKEIEEIKQIISKYTDKLPDNVAFDIANDDIRYQIVSNLIDKNTNYRNQIKELRQAKTDFAIEQLEKVKEFCEDYIEFKNEHQENWLYEYIDQQIKKLKHEDKGENK